VNFIWQAKSNGKHCAGGYKPLISALIGFARGMSARQEQPSC
jgi:hypothetical protein